VNELAWFRSWYEPLLNRFTSVLKNLVVPRGEIDKSGAIVSGHQCSGRGMANPG